jgi:two-component system cell cycle sensor histidine kinase/response regulator CckA
MTEMRKLEEPLLQSCKMAAVVTLVDDMAYHVNNVFMGIHGETSMGLFNRSAGNQYSGRLKNIESRLQRSPYLTSNQPGVAQCGKDEFVPTDMDGLVKRSTKIFGRAKKEIRIHCRHAKQLWAVEADSGQMDHLLLNIYINAWQSMPEGGDLYVETDNVMLDDLSVRPFKVSPGPYVKVSVSDTGVGMDEETRERVFDPFFATKDRGTSLAAVYTVVKNHGGLINLHSEKGKGTTVVFHLPATHKPVVKPIKPDHQLQQGSETILVIDDEDAVLHVTGEVLSVLGYRVLLAGNGYEGVEIYRTHCDKIDLVILDMMMSEMTGYETFKAMKKMNPDVNVLFSSGDSMNRQAEEMIDCGCRGFIRKPFNVEELSEKVSEIINENKCVIRQSVAM